jgi:hypothetical protein
MHTILKGHFVIESWFFAYYWGSGMCIWGREPSSLQHFLGVKVVSEVVTGCTDRSCPMFGRVHWHCPCCGEVLVVKLEVLDGDWPFPEDYRFIKREHCTGTTW